MKLEINSENFKKFSTRAVIIPVFSSFLLSGIFIYIIFQLLDTNAQVVQSARVLRQANENMQLIVSSETAVRGYLLTSNSTFLEPYIKNRNTIPEGLDRLIEMTQDNVGQTNRAKDMKIAYEEWIPYGQKVIELKSKKSKNIEEVLSSLEGKEKMDKLRAIFNRFIEVEQTLREQRIQETEKTTHLTLGLILGFSIISGIIIALFTKRQLTSLSTTYHHLIEKQITQNKILENQEWIQTGKNSLMDKIMGDLSTEEVSEKALQFICHYLDCKAGAIYNLESGMLRMTASYALMKEESQRIIKLGEGLVGQTALDNKINIISNVPQQHLTIASGLSSRQPHQIIILPLFADKAVKGVMELAFLDSSSQEMISFLHEISESLAISLKSAEYRSTLSSLLEEAQRQTEILKTQQEELQASNEELEEQANALRESQLKLEAQQAELEQSNVQLTKQSFELETQASEVNRKNSELQFAQKELEFKAQELERAGQYKSQFLANMSHELRTPLNSTLILSQLLMEDKRNRLGKEEIEFAKTIYSSSQDLLNLINDILDLSKVEAGKIDLEPTEIIVSEFVETLKRLFQPIVDSKKLKFEIVVSPSTPKAIFLDRLRLEQILKNLLSNAIKFTAKGSVSLMISSEKERIYFAVKDTGIGIPKEQHNLVFSAFKQADETTSRKYGGTGLGLTISKDLAKLLGGTIQLVSEKDKGSTFTLDLPVKLDLESNLSHTIPTHLSTPVEFVPAPVSSTSDTEKSDLPSVPPLPFKDDRLEKNKDINILLIVEDDTIFAKVLYDLGHELHYNCIVAQSAKEGIKFAKEFNPKSILLDMNLPDQNGLTVIDALKSDPKTSFIPIHIISAHDFSDQALKMGAIGYLKKPALLEEIKDVILKLENASTEATKKVLVIEDNHVQRESIKKLIQDEGTEVITAENAQEALTQLKRHTFKCMILDLTLPGMNGHELLEELTLQKTINTPPVIVYTGKDLSKQEEQKLQRYSKSIILKGAYSPERLYSEVNLFLHQKEEALPKERQKMLQEIRNREKFFEERKILLVDDDVRNIFALSSALESKGAIIEIARNGKEAVEQVKNDPSIDLVLMDIMMPEMDGYTATREIRKDPRFKALPIIAVTAKAMSDDQEKCREAGANDYLAKPIDLTKLLSLLRVWMPTKWTGSKDA